jgi:hypothetical protein
VIAHLNLNRISVRNKIQIRREKKIKEKKRKEKRIREWKVIRKINNYIKEEIPIPDPNVFYPFS